MSTPRGLPQRTLRESRPALTRPTQRLYPLRAAKEEDPPRLPAKVDANGDMPAHPGALPFLYLEYGVAAVTERIWRFGMPLCLMQVTGGFHCIALSGFVGQLMVFLCSPALGQLLDDSPRVATLITLAVTQAASFLVLAMATLAAVTYYSGATPIQGTPLLGLILAVSATERVLANAYDVAIERDWVVQLVGQDRDVPLANANAWIRRFDHASELVGTLAFGSAVTIFGARATLLGYAAMLALSMPAQVALIRKIARVAPQAMVEGEGHTAGMSTPQTPTPDASPPSFAPQAILAFVAAQVSTTVASWRTFFAQPVVLPSLAYISVYFNVALAPGGLITALLSGFGLSGTVLAAFRGCCAVFSFLGTVVGPWGIGRIGLLRTGAAALLLQASCLTGAALVYQQLLVRLPSTYGLSAAAAELAGAGLSAAQQASSLPAWALTRLAGIPAAIWAFCLLIIVSRVGMWVLDLVHAQVFQVEVPRSKISAVSSTESALCGGAELIMLGVATVWSEPRHFSMLMFMSLASIWAAMGMYTTWSSRKGGGATPARA